MTVALLCGEKVGKSVLPPTDKRGDLRGITPPHLKNLDKEQLAPDATSWFVSIVSFIYLCANVKIFF